MMGDPRMRATEAHGDSHFGRRILSSSSLHEPDLGALASRRRVPNCATAPRRRDAGAPRFMVPMRVQCRRWRLPMNLGGVRVPSNPDHFWRSSMSGLDGFRLGDYSSERVSPHRSRAQYAHKVRGVLILASDRLKAGRRAFPTYVVPASAGGAPTLPDALDCLNLKTALQPKETKEFEGLTQTRPPTYRVNGRCLRTSFLSAFFVSFGHPTAGLSLTRCRLKAVLGVICGHTENCWASKYDL